MPLDFSLFAQAGAGEFFLLPYIDVIGVCLLGFLLPILIGWRIDRKWRGYGWKIGLILVTVLLAGMVVVPPRSFWEPSAMLNVKLGVDLQGGVILIYEVDEEASLPGQEEGDDGRFEMGALIEALSRRINPSGTKEIVIRPYGEKQVEIIIPEVDQREVDQVKRELVTAGVLQFRIVANDRDHDDVIALAREMADDPLKKRSRIVRNEAGENVGLWARVDRIQEEVNGVRPFRLAVGGYVLRDASTGEILSTAGHAADEPQQLAEYIDSLGIREIDVLMATDDGYDVTGADLGAVSKGFDEVMRPCIFFNMRGDGSNRFAGLTSEFSPDSTGFQRQLGIVLDDVLLSAPNIHEMIQGRGRITGRFSDEDVEFIVRILQAGSLPVVLNKIPISENEINPLLGQSTIEQGRWAILISLTTVLVFILIYYRVAGIVACMALVANLLFILALMILIKAAFTLPGLAGLVLTVGMSVDANVLIFERIREELSRGAALRMAIRNGFGRATTTIVDANLTTLITALVLYAIGTDQIRGFAVTLILGILMSMFTAIFCSRVIFDLAERSRKLKQLRMNHLLGATEIDFIGMRKIAAVCSIVLILFGIGSIVQRGRSLFDIDFNGGTSVHVKFDSQTQINTELVREKLTTQFESDAFRNRYGSQDFTLTAMNNPAGDANSENIFKVDSSLQEVDDLKEQIRTAFQNDQRLQLAHYSVERVGPLKAVQPEAGIAPAAAAPNNERPQADAQETTAPDNRPDTTPPAEAGSAPAETSENETKSDAKAKSDAPAGTEAPEGAAQHGRHSLQLALAAAPGLMTILQGEASPAETAPEKDASAEPQAPQETPADEAQRDAAASPDPPPSDDGAASAAPGGAPAQSAPQADAPSGQTPDATATDRQSTFTPPAASDNVAAGTQIEAQLKFAHAINAETLSGEIEETAQQLNIPLSYFELENPDWDGTSSNGYLNWTVRFSATEEQVEQLLSSLEQEFLDTPVWPSSSKIGSQVADRMREKATYALLTSLLGIVVYIWIRFQRVIFGLAAVVALVHDVLITLGAIALSAYVADALGFLLIEEFKISLPIVAALLTIIGYSLNDTIVVFDRIREVRGRSPELTGKMINVSINQTLSRTLLTSMTTMIVVLILYAIGGQGIHGFAFALVVGVTVGTYSSIFVASPALLWMGEMQARSASGKGKPAAKAG